MGKKYSSDSKNAWGFSYDFSVNKPIDTRSVVDNFEDLINPETWKVGADYMCYTGMAVACADTGKIYVYKGVSGVASHINQENNWVSQGEALSKADPDNLGGIKTGYTEITGEKKYSIQVDEKGHAYVYVPWVDTKYSLLAANANSLGGVKVTGDKGLVMGGTNNEELAVNFDDTDYSEVEDITTHQFPTNTVASPNTVKQIMESYNQVFLDTLGDVEAARLNLYNAIYGTDYTETSQIPVE